MEILIDAKNSVVGRIAGFAAKKALQGNKVVIVNSEKALITGDPKKILTRYLEKTRLGHIVQKGPNLPRRSEMILKRIIRGMLPYKKAKGKEAYKNIKCILGVPEKYVKAEKLTFNKIIKTKSITLEKLSKIIRQK